jgi:ribosomal protein S18 acetylase RimI-like enzyme
MAREMPSLTRVPFEMAYAPEVASWLRDPRDVAMLTTVHSAPLAAETLRQWSGEPGGTAFVFLEGGAPRAYAELWEEPEDDEAEIARIVVAPEQRRRGIALVLVGALVEEARARGYGSILLRVVPENEGAIACYGRAGFVRVTAELEATLNDGQPLEYIWMAYARD